MRTGARLHLVDGSAPKDRIGARANWHRADIIAAIRKRGESMRSLGVHHAKGPRTLAAALTVPARPSNQIIAEFLDIPHNELWPEWFCADGQYLDAARQIIDADCARRRRFPTRAKTKLSKRQRAVAAVGSVCRALRQFLSLGGMR